MQIEEKIALKLHKDRDDDQALGKAADILANLHESTDNNGGFTIYYDGDLICDLKELDNALQILRSLIALSDNTRLDIER